MRWSKRNKTVGLVSVLVVAVVIVVVVMVAQNNNSPTLRTAQVTITSQGFIPNELSVKPNTKVTWTNTDTKGHTVGANPYPSHDSLKALASKALIDKQSYSYTFTKVGTYHYHDDLNPTLNATIVVQK